MARFEYRLLGAFEVLRDGQPVHVPAAKLRVLLAALLIDANEIVSVGELARRIWDGDAPDGARNTIQNYVLRLRRLLGAAGSPLPVRSSGTGYILDVERGTLDVDIFRELQEDAQHAVAREDCAAAAKNLRAALDLWRGQPLVDVPSDVLRREYGLVLAEQWRTAVEQRIEVDLQLGRHRELIAELQHLTATYPLAENFWRQRMTALYRSGRRSEALGCYHAISKRLIEEIGIEPGVELRELHRAMLSPDPGPAEEARPAPARGNLPAESSSFVGRGPLLQQTVRALRECRLVTLTGVGGVGKTRLAVRAAAGPAPFDGGRWLVDATSARDRATLIQAFAETGLFQGIALDAWPAGLALRDRGRRVLLVLDNCEHVIDHVRAAVTQLLRSSPNLHVLATSREVMGIAGENVLQVPPLDVTGVNGAVAEAVELFASRARSVAPGFSASGENGLAVTELCRRLDGLPLAIELAAARLNTLSVAEILDRLDGSRLLARAGGVSSPRHHQTIRDVVDWSFRLCADREKRLWASLSVFRGTFDLAAVEAVCGDHGIPDGAVVDVLSGLVRKSVVTARTGSGVARYHMLESIRDFGWEKLLDSADLVAVRRRHCAHYRDEAARSVQFNWGNRDEVAWQTRTALDLPNLRAAMDFATGSPDEGHVGLEMSLNLARSAFFTGNVGEARRWIDRCLERGTGCRPGQRSDALAMSAWMATMQGQEEAAAEALARLPAPEAERPWVLFAAGTYGALVLADPQAINTLATARDRLSTAAAGDRHMATLFWAIAAVCLGGPDVARTASKVGLAEAEELGGTWSLSWARWTCGLAELLHGRPSDATELFVDALALQHRIGDRWGPLWTVETTAWARAACGQLRQAATLMGVAATLRGEADVRLAGLFRKTHETFERAVRGGIGDAAFEELFASSPGVGRSFPGSGDLRQCRRT